MKDDHKYTVEKILYDWNGKFPLYEYRLKNEFGLTVATVCCEDLAVRIKDLLNGDVE